MSLPTGCSANRLRIALTIDGDRLVLGERPHRPRHACRSGTNAELMNGRKISG